MKRPVFGVLLFLVINCFTVFAKDTLAVLPFSGGNGEDGETIAELFMFDPAIIGAFSLIPRTSITRAMRREQTFQLSGGTIRGNTAQEYGGGVYVRGTFIKTGGTIDATNKAKAGNVAFADKDNKKRNSTAGPNDNLDSSKSGRAGGWE